MPVRTRGSGALTAVASFVLIMSGCSFGAAPSFPYLDVRAAPPLAEAAAARCPRDGVGLGAGDLRLGAGPTPGTLPATFVPTRVRLCRLDDAGPAPDGHQAVNEETSPVDARLLGSLTLPDQAFDPRDHAACAAVYAPPVYLLLVDRANHAFRPHLPTEPCGRPRAEVQAAIDALAPTSVTTYTFAEGDPGAG